MPKLSSRISPKPGDARRSPHWPSVRKAHLKREPCCQICGRKVHLNVHHIRPFHLHPELELEESNLITLCEPGGFGCHLLIGHWCDFHAYNPHVRRWARNIRTKIATRPRA